MEQPNFNIGTLGNVSHGKSTLVRAITGTNTQKHSKEKIRGCTMKLGYANTKIYYQADKDLITTNSSRIDLNSSYLNTRYISFVDCPGHEMLKRVALSGTSVVDALILIVSANEICPQPQTIEHLIALDAVMRQKRYPNIIIVQNKIDLVTKQRALENLNEIKELIKGSIAQNAPIIPISAQFGLNIDLILRQIMAFKNQPNTESHKFRMNILRSFDINKPGTDLKTIAGGVIGGSIQSGQLAVGDTIYISPNGFQTTVVSMNSDKSELEKASYGGLISIQTTLDPNLTINDRMVGNLISKEIIPVFDMLYLNCKWIRSAKVKIEVGTELILNIHSATVSAFITNKKSRLYLEVKLTRSIACDYTDLVFLSVKNNSKDVLCGVANIVNSSYESMLDQIESEKIDVIDFDYECSITNILSKVVKETHLKLPPLELERDHTKILFSNFPVIVSKLNTNADHLMQFIIVELGLPSHCFSLTSEHKLKIRKVVRQGQLETILKSYVKEYMVCRACKSTMTKLENNDIICRKCHHVRNL